VLTLTHAAVELIHDLKAQPGVASDMGLRITTQHEVDGNRLAISFAEEPALGDQVVEAEDVRLYLQDEAADILDGKVLDARLDEQGEPGFLIENQTP
jgi:Fe-S cluster assembly iron-binding protein IscA